MKKKRRPPTKPGNVYKVPLGEGWHTYAQVIRPPLTAFFDARTQSDLTVEEIVERPVLFRIWVMRYSFSDWPMVGKSPIRPDIQVEPFFFKQDILKPENLWLYQLATEWPATYDQCKGLEPAAVWDPEHVVDRLQDHYAGRSNKWVESMKLKRAEAD